MRIVWTPIAWEDYVAWQSQDAKMVGAINALLKDITRDPFRGLGKPEPLRHGLSGWWSRRITGEHRLVYRVAGEGTTKEVEIASCRYHY